MVEKKQLYGFFQEIDNDFSPSLSSKVDIEEYTIKILNNAELIADVDHELRGLVVLYCNDVLKKKAYIPLCGVRKDYRGNGIARNLMIRAIETARIRGMKVLGIHSNNEIALNLYKSLGFITKEFGDREYLELEL